ncbi:MAG: hypothetical protein HOP12_06000 [Candidatus Eisenbacteria bacterium]|uniref:Putative zinc-finger domain-containing protein n=1 Tax=Eiseniibacteriota bacterium TaxID=2212470 RepID=A0A849SQN4_UNCEI|nr:hypothetical protein [Candidatus Eisenbacteria bacterium]
MTCGQSRKLFSAYWDDELSLAEREWLETHFTSCSGCRGEYDEFTRVVEWSGSLPRVEVAPDFAERTLARARRVTAAPDRVPSGTPRWVTATAAVALLAVGGTLALQFAVRGPDSSSSGAPMAVQAPLLQPERVVPTGTPAVATPSMSDPGAERVAVLEPLGELSDSLFDRSDDVEFVLDPVAIRKGRAHSTTRITPPTVHGEAATITF